jgi:hypothetical protein
VPVTRELIAWLLWCANQGYLHPDDRALLDNHFLPDAGPLHPDDAAEVPHWLEMADQVLAAIQAGQECP